MPTASTIASRSVSGSVRLRRGKLRSTWYAAWRDAAGHQHQDKLGLLWEDKGEPPAGYLRRKDAEAALQALLTDARRGGSEQRRLGTSAMATSAPSMLRASVDLRARAAFVFDQ